MFKDKLPLKRQYAAPLPTVLSFQRTRAAGVAQANAHHMGQSTRLRWRVRTISPARKGSASVTANVSEHKADASAAPVATSAIHRLRPSAAACHATRAI